MKTPERDAPGVVEWFRIGEHDAVDDALRLMRAIGVNRLRTHLSWADYHTVEGRAWYDWLMPKLSSEVELLPCVHYTPPSLSENGKSNGPPKDLQALADFADEIITRYGAHFEALELWNEPNNLLDWDWRLDNDWVKFCTMLGMAAHWTKARGKKAVLGGLCPTDQNLLRVMGERGLFEHLDVVGIHGFPGTWDSEEAAWDGWEDLLAATRATVSPFNPNLEFWITETGYSTWRRDGAAQARRYLEAMGSTADRVYWYALKDLPVHVASQEGYHFDERHYHLGLHDETGHPKLTARLLAHGGQTLLAEVLSLARPAPAIVGRKPIVVTGGAGFIGSNVAASLAADGHDVLVLDALMRDGVESNLAWLRQRHPQRISAIIGDIRDVDVCREAMRDAAGVFHFAAQVAVTSSLVEPVEDFGINLSGTVNMLEATRRKPVPFIFASTNKVYGNLADVALTLNDGGYRPVDGKLHKSGVGESRPIEFHTPYGCSKGAADQYVLDYARSYQVPTAVLRMSCIYGQRQFGTEDQGWVAHFLIRALKGEPITIYGDGHQVRDILHVDDAVRAYRAVFDRIGDVSGEAFNLGGGPRNAVSLRSLIAHIESVTGRAVDTRFEDWRQGDQRYYVSDTSRLTDKLGVKPTIDWRRGVEALRNWLEDAVVPAHSHPANPISEVL